MAAFLLLTLACSTPDPCAGPQQQWSAGDTSGALHQFPDDAWTVADDSSPTGRRVTLPSAFVEGIPSALGPMAAPALDRSGAGRLGAIVMSFDGKLGALPETAEQSLEDAGIWLIDLETGERKAYTAALWDADTVLEVQPLAPLDPGHQHALVLTRDHQTASGRCVAPAPEMAALWEGEGSAELLDIYGDLPETLGLEAWEISAATVFTTQDEVAEIAGISAAIDPSSLAWDGPLECSATSGGQRCEGSFTAQDHRVDGGTLSPESQGSYTLAVNLYLPEGDAPAPFFIYGHGLASSRGEGSWIFRRVSDLGFAVITVDALEHGDHPTAADDNDSDAVAFLGFSLSPLALDGQKLIHNFLQTNLDRLQLMALLMEQPDLDGDGEPELDTERVAYVGVSLGGLLGAGFLAQAPSVEIASLPLAGGHLVSFAQENELVGSLTQSFIDQMASEGEYRKLLAIAQTALDPADPAVWAAHVRSQRLDDAEPPHVHMPVSTWDQVVPVVAGEYMARGLDLPLIQPQVNAVNGLRTGPSAPVSANEEGLTAGFFQFDRATVDGEVVPSDHTSVISKPEGELQFRHYLQTWLETGTPEILDPYAELGTPEL